MKRLMIAPAPEVGGWFSCIVTENPLRALVVTFICCTSVAALAAELDASVINGSEELNEVMVLVALLPKSAVVVAVPIRVKVKDVLMEAVKVTLGRMATRVSEELSCVPPIMIRYEPVPDGLVMSFVAAAPIVIVMVPAPIVSDGQTVHVIFSSVPLL